MRLGLALGYGGEPIEEVLPLVETAERIGVDSLWSVEEYGPDAVSVLGYLAARTSRAALGTAVMQVPARTPAATAMTAMSLDMLSGGRFRLGLGSSVPWIVEGWHGQPYARRLRRIREYVEIVRLMVAGQDRVAYDGEIYRLPYQGPGSSGRARPVKSEMEPLRPRIPVYLAAIGPRTARLAGEIADGWLPGIYAPEHETALTRPLDEGIRLAGRAASDVDIAPILYVARADDLGEARDRLRPLFAHLIGATAAGVRNTYFDVVCQMGYEGPAHAIRSHYAARHRGDAVAAVPDALLDSVALVGPLPAIVDRILAWKDSRVGTLIVLTRDVELLEAAQAAL